MGKMEYLGKKIKTSIALDEDLLRWIDKQIQTKRFASRTHAIEFAVEQLRRT
jgi:Arc/MetJ-type ribon-helix-helix transcriptional regulator